MTEMALSGISARISRVSNPVPPVSAICSIPGVAVSPEAQKLALSLCTAPISGEKWAPDGKSVGCVVALQVALKVTL